MEQLIDFFTAPYQNTAAIYIILEFTAALLGIISVFYAKKENILVFPTGIVSTGMYIFLLYRWQLYGDLIINIYYTLMSIYGWYMWLKVVNTRDDHSAITRSNIRDYIITVVIFIVSSAFILAVYIHFDVISIQRGFISTIHYIGTHISSGKASELRKITPYLDTFTTGAAFAAMWMMANKKLESWILWIAVNIVSVPLYFIKGFGFTGLQYSVFLILAFMGYYSWRKALLKDDN